VLAVYCAPSGACLGRRFAATAERFRSEGKLPGDVQQKSSWSTAKRAVGLGSCSRSMSLVVRLRCLHIKVPPVLVLRLLFAAFGGVPNPTRPRGELAHGRHGCVSAFKPSLQASSCMQQGFRMHGEGWRDGRLAVLMMQSVPGWVCFVLLCCLGPGRLGGAAVGAREPDLNTTTSS